MYWAKNELQNIEDIKHIKHLSPWSKTATWKFCGFFKSFHSCLTIKFIHLYLHLGNVLTSDCWDEAVLWNLRRWEYVRLKLLTNKGALTIRKALEGENCSDRGTPFCLKICDIPKLKMPYLLTSKLFWSRPLLSCKKQALLWSEAKLN